MLFPPQHKNKINRAGELIVNSEESRYQMRNLAICLEKIRVMVTEATEKPKVVSKETAQELIARYCYQDGLYLIQVQTLLPSHVKILIWIFFLKNHWCTGTYLLSKVTRTETVFLPVGHLNLYYSCAHS